MDTNKTTTTKSSSFPKADAPRAFSEVTEKSAMQTKETYEKMIAASIEAADLIKISSSTALKGWHDYNNKFLEFARTNTNAAFDVLQKLNDVKSPSEFMVLLTEHVRAQTQTLTEQTKTLVELAQKIALAGAKPLQEGVAKAFNRAA